MLGLSDGMLLYHGSYCEVNHPNLAKCSGAKDFGRGFYLTSSREQAENFINTSLKKAKAQGITEWLHCVVGHRKVNTFPGVVEQMKQYDIIAGKIADDATNVTILTYLVGAYGTIGSQEADELCIGRLIPERLKDQFCFRTEAGLNCLSFVESEQIWKN